jgi:hypothetical protein
MTHPYREVGRQTGKHIVGLDNLKLRNAIFPLLRGLDRSSIVLSNQLEPITDPQDRDYAGKDLRVTLRCLLVIHACRPARQNYP